MLQADQERAAGTVEIVHRQSSAPRKHRGLWRTDACNIAAQMDSFLEHACSEMPIKSELDAGRPWKHTDVIQRQNVNDS